MIKRCGTGVTRGLVGLVVTLMLGLATSAGANSLYNEATYRPLTADNKAYRVGDLITVLVFENSSAQSSADTGTRRNSDVSANLVRPGNQQTAIGLRTTGEFDGGGQTQRAHRLLTTLTVVVQEVLPNGDLRLAGEQLLTVNNEQQKVTLEGRVRPHDVLDNNTVVSTRIADAKITYVGEGDVSERNRRSWLRKLLDWIGF